MPQANLLCLQTYLSKLCKHWDSTHKIKLKKVQSEQKIALCIIFNQSQTSPSGPLFLTLNVLNVYQFNIFQSVQFMHKMKKNVPHIFLKPFSVPCHAYPTNFSLINFSVPGTFLKTTRFAM